ncbi:hypothetical protein OPQ81_010593 [Rhizoctonia solani]|nr:hypothetical protein OPQ81_010593 [Rhizoctonia solani]
MMYANDSEGVPIACVPNPNIQTEFLVEESGLGSNRYILSSTRFPYRIGAAPDNLQVQDYPFTTLNNFQWSIEPAGPDCFKIHIPNMNVCWFLPDTEDNEIRILLRPAEGYPEEIWKMVRIRDN